MTTVHQLSRTDARRIAVQAQLLDAQRPAALLNLVRHLSRLGSSYDTSELRGALEDRTLVELMAMVRPAEDIALYRPTWRTGPGRASCASGRIICEWVESNDACRRDILARLQASGPLTMRDLSDTCAAPYQSTGWTNDRNVEKLLNFMVQRGEVAVAGRQGKERAWDLARRVYPDDPVVAAEEAERTRDRRRLRRSASPGPAALSLRWSRLAWARRASPPSSRGSRASGASTHGGWVVRSWGRTALLSPFDRLAHDRKRAVELLDYDYQLEMYKPAATGVRRELKDLARWLEFDLVLPG